MVYFWVDTCCINKTNQAEVSETICSMFRWYKSAEKCYVYLADVAFVESDSKPGRMTDFQQSRWYTRWWRLPELTEQEKAFRESRWHTRCWTLPELLAPASVEFFSREGQRIGDKKSFEQLIYQFFGIPIRALQGEQETINSFSLTTRRSWARKRDATRVEDKTYCLFGILNIFMPVIYGEGANAAVRLRNENDRLKLQEDEINKRRFEGLFGDREPLGDTVLSGTRGRKREREEWDEWDDLDDWHEWEAAAAKRRWTSRRNYYWPPAPIPGPALMMQAAAEAAELERRRRKQLGFSEISRLEEQLRDKTKDPIIRQNIAARLAHQKLGFFSINNLQTQL